MDSDHTRILATQSHASQEASLDTSSELPSNASTLPRRCHAQLLLLLHKVKTSDYHELFDFFSDEESRFMLWAKKNRALEHSLVSFDFAMGRSKHVRTCTKSALERLADALRRMLDIIEGHSPNRCDSNEAAIQTPAGLAVLSKKIISQTLFDPFASQTSQPLTTRPSTTELAELFLNLHSVNTHLLDLSTLLQQEQPRNTARGPIRADINARDEVVDFLHNFPVVQNRQWLAERLAKLVAQRRHWIYSRQTIRQSREKHVTFPSTSTAVPASSGSDPVHPREPSQDAGLPGDNKGYSPSDESVQHSKLQNSPSSTTPNNFRGSRVLLRDDFVAWRGPLPGSTTTDSVRTLPKLETLRLNGIRLRYNTRIECPLCRTNQLFRDGDEWEFHVFSDLKLFACTSERCSVRSFRSEAEWFDHETGHHRRRWVCHLCHLDLPTAFGFAIHLSSFHKKEFSKDQLGVALEACEKPQVWFEASDCPFCLHWDPRRGTSGSSNNSKLFSAHVGSHFRYIALNGLPRMLNALEFEGMDVRVDPAPEHLPQDRMISRRLNHPTPSIGIRESQLFSPLEKTASSMTPLCVEDSDGSSESETTEMKSSLRGPASTSMTTAASTRSTLQDVSAGSSHRALPARRSVKSTSSEHHTRTWPSPSQTHEWFGNENAAVPYEKATHWACHSCGEGPFDVATTESCLVCHHQCCSYCRAASEYPCYPQFGDVSADEFNMGLTQGQGLFY